MPVPWELKKYLAPWAGAECLSYDFGIIIRQVLATADFRICASVLNITRPVQLYPYWDTPAIALQYIRQGSICACLNGTAEVSLDASRYSLFHIRAGQHVYRPQEGLSELLRIEISPRFLQELQAAHPLLQQMLDNLRKGHQTGELLYPARMNGKVKHILHEIYQCRKTGPSLHLEMKAHIYSLLSAYDEEITLAHNLESIQASKMEKTLLAVKHYITDYPHIHECSLESMSRHFNISSSALKLNFKRQYHISLGDFVQQQCMLKAQQLLAGGADPVRDIALQLGYTDVSNFSRAFRNYTGRSPHEMRIHPEQASRGRH
ncbi:AraC family transcriptional regulator [Chitinophaga japonensis]|uniref:AraC family transcriptional regulator n=1 Tax=Chitinophaga japonensis TaxID=104662 RepID=UPI0013159E75|nr:AraC family transcriptional regulator [Chitinophaga japonensis]